MDAFSLSVCISSGILLSFLGVLVYLNIRNYRISKRAYLKKKGLIDANRRVFYLIKEHLDSISRRYPQYVFIDLSAKVFFILNSIKNLKNLEVQNVYMKKTYDRLYESTSRLKENYMDVAGIIAPLNDLIKEIERGMNEKSRV